MEDETLNFRYYLFPFDEVDKGAKIVIYGAGEVGRQFIGQIMHLNYCDCLFFIDGNFEKLRQINGVEVLDPKSILKYEYDRIVIATALYCDEVYNTLLDLGVPGSKIVKKIVAHEYDRRMPTPDPQDRTAWNTYYKNAESAAQDQFNNYFSPVLAQYKDICLDKILDFACGRGRMANIFSLTAKSITCCDANDVAINYCKNRFMNVSNCSFDYINNGRTNNALNDLPIESNSFSFIYSWDAMVHFSYKWLDFYIKEFYRILSNDSYAFIHHSNYANVEDDESENWYDHPHGRSSVSRYDVAFIAQNHGFTVLEQRIINWGIPNLDCISILKK